MFGSYRIGGAGQGSEAVGEHFVPVVFAWSHSSGTGMLPDHFTGTFIACWVGIEAAEDGHVGLQQFGQP